RSKEAYKADIKSRFGHFDIASPVKQLKACARQIPKCGSGVRGPSANARRMHRSL
ncbi:hypothetical protein A2U01_0089554, partial [Trifolium medium]|nr:hypothetical protein [Trifolium medium]